MNTRPFTQDATQSEKREILHNDRGVARLHLIAKPVSSAADPTSIYPRLPNGPWSGADIVGIEPPHAPSPEARERYAELLRAHEAAMARAQRGERPYG